MNAKDAGSLKTGWYAFGKEDGSIPDALVFIKDCGTHYSIPDWLTPKPIALRAVRAMNADSGWWFERIDIPKVLLVEVTHGKPIWTVSLPPAVKEPGNA